MSLEGKVAIVTGAAQGIGRAIAETFAWQGLADVVVEPAVRSIEWDQFDRTHEARQAGAAAMREALPRLLQLLERPARDAEVARGVRSHTGSAGAEGVALG